jgi:hypothetical protein
LGSLGALLNSLGASSGSLGTLLGSLGASLRLFRGSLMLSWAPLGSLGALPSPHKAFEGLKKPYISLQGLI